MDPFALDIRTLSFTTTSIALFFSVGFLSLGAFQIRFKGFYLLALACFSHSLGLFLLGLRDILPDMVTVVVANTIILMGAILYLEATRRFLGTATSIHPLGIIILPVFIASFVYFTYYSPSVNNRILSIAAALAIFSFLTAREFAHRLPAYVKLPKVMTASIFIIYGLFQVFRFIWTLGESTIQSFMAAGTVHAFAFILVIFLITGTSFGFIWIMSKRLESELQGLANQDQLTQLLNRRGVDALVTRELSKMRRDSSILAIAMIDLDHFKRVNDRFGHHIGDLTLTSFANLIKGSLRSHDIFGRIGGEEFLLILPQTSGNQAMDIAERLRKIIETHIFKLEGHEIQITASIGVAVCDTETNSLKELIPLADKALYKSKQLGRNKVSFIP